MRPLTLTQEALIMSGYKILSKARKAVFDGVPNLSPADRKALMVQSRETKSITRNLRSKESKVGFLVQRAYFQSKGRFFKTEQFKKADIKEAEKSLGLRIPCDITKYNDKTAASHRQIIRAQHGWKPFDLGTRASLIDLALIHSKEQLDMEDTLFSLLEYCWRNKVEIPGYNILEGIIVEAFEKFLQDTLTILDKYITQRQRDVLLSFIENPEIAKNLSKIKRVNQGIDQTSLIENARALELFRDAFFEIQSLLEKLSLSNQAIKELSRWIYNSDLAQIKRFKNVPLLLLRLMAFIRDQFYLRQDYAIDAIMKKIRTTVNKARGFDRKQRESLQDEIRESKKSVLNSARNANGVIRLIGKISKDNTIPLPERNEKVINLVDSYLEAVDPSFDAHVAKMEKELEAISFYTNFYDYLFGNASPLIRSLCPLAKAIVFDDESSNKELLYAIRAFKEDNFKIDNNTPLSFMNKRDLAAYERDDGRPKITKYKIILLAQIDESIRDRILTLKYSYRFLADEDFLIRKSEYKQNEDAILFSNSLEHLKNGEKVLEDLGKKLTSSYESFNREIRNNSFIVLDKNNNWKTKKDEADYSASEFIPKLIDDGGARTLYEMLSEIDSYTDFSDHFRNYQVSHGKQTIDNKLLYAVLMSLGTNLGHGDMAKACKFSVKQLRDTEKAWFSTTNIKNANEKIVKLIQELPLPTIFNDNNDMIHTSSDGKKIVVAVDSLLANYSYKYYGKEQGVTVNSFVDTKQSFFHVNILTSSDREAAYMMDGLAKTKPTIFSERNDEIDSDLFNDHKHSTDMHGYTDAMFSGLHFLDVSFAPRLIDLPSRALFAYDSKSLVKNSCYIVGPKQQINKRLILENWDDMLRLMATIKSGKQSASLIFRRLAAGKRERELYKAFKELGRLIKSYFIVKYLGNEELRRSIQKQLNRVELGQKFSNALFFGKKGQLNVGGEEDIQRVMLCKTFLKNVVILWNYLYLSDYILGLDDENEIEHVLESISEGSVISWRHVNVHGVYNFDHKPIKSFKATINQMRNMKVRS